MVVVAMTSAEVLRDEPGLSLFIYEIKLDSSGLGVFDL